MSDPKPEKARFDIGERLTTIPDEPGVYLMKNRRGKIVYVGKSVNLKARVRSYFNGGDPRPFVTRLSHILGEIETIITATEKEALILENTLIKAHKPRYNVRLRDDKNYLSLKINTKARWPRIQVTRRIGKDARYFGPFHSASSIRRTLQVLNKHFMLRTCSDSVLNNRARPCLQYQIKRCPGPCVFDVDKDAYSGQVQNAILFLDGRHPELKTRLETKMGAAAEALEFELAAHYRDQLRAIDTALEHQQAVSTRFVDQDILGMYREADRVTIQLLLVRSGKLESTRVFSFGDQEFPSEEICSTFLNLYYQGGSQIPAEVLLPFPIEEASSLSAVLADLKGGAVTIRTPQRGAGKQLIDTASINAKTSFHEEHLAHERILDQLVSLQKRLRLKALPERMECFDISNFQGDPIVGSMVVFQHGTPAKKEYRHFKVKSVDGQDDFASLYEVLTRRFERSVKGDWPWPDLVVIDGGKGQLKQAVTVLEDLGIDTVDVAGLAKSRVESDVQSPHVEKSMERVFLPGRKNPVILRQNSAELFLLQRMRDEAHRFAIEFHRKLRRKQTLTSSLDDIPGIGPKRRAALLSHFEGISGVRDASVEALASVPGVNQKTARDVFVHFNGKLALDSSGPSA